MGSKFWAEEEVALRAQWEREVLPKLEADPEAFKTVRAVFQVVSEGRLEHVTVDFDALRQPKRDMAEERRKWFEDLYKGLGLTVTVPRPSVSNREFDRRTKAGQALFYRPATTEVSYEVFMASVGQGQHYTVVDEAERAKIVWESASAGYWFWAEVAEACPRLKTPWNRLNTTIKLLALEEYMVVWWAMKAKGVVLDVSTWTWLRTRYQFAPGRLGALNANECRGWVNVNRYGSVDLSFACDFDGGRLAEVVQVVA